MIGKSRVPTGGLDSPDSSYAKASWSISGHGNTDYSYGMTNNDSYGHNFSPSFDGSGIVECCVESDGKVNSTRWDVYYSYGSLFFQVFLQRNN